MRVTNIYFSVWPSSRIKTRVQKETWQMLIANYDPSRIQEWMTFADEQMAIWEDLMDPDFCYGTLLYIIIGFIGR
jgi:hypothetical protein